VRTVFVGTSDFAVPVLEALAASPHRPELVVSSPDRPRGRGRRIAAPPVAAAARGLGLEVLQPERLDEPAAFARVQATAPDTVCVCAYGALLREPLLSRWPVLNVHPSLLPRWRGAAPIERAIMAGDAETGVSIMRVEAALDAGPVCLAARAPIAADDDYGALAAQLARLGGRLLLRALDERPDCSPQAADGVTYAEKIAPGDRRLDPARETAAALERRVRALTPHIGAYLELQGGGRLGVWRAAATADCGPPAGALAGAGERLLLGCASGTLELLELQPPGGRPMSAAAYLRGHRVPA
jgi:methionyl-tRNA formyltransferase